MKKLLVLAAIIVAGVAANAASFKWTAANIYGANGTDKFSGTADMYAYLATADASTAVKVASASIVSGVVKNGTANGYTFASDDLTSGTAYNFYFVIEDNGKAFTSVVKTATGADVGDAGLAWGNMATATQSASNWAAVPEPTSGLLMLLGMAGLALRRRRA